MPDITMCRTATCPVKESCYRYIAKPDYYQAFSDFSHLVTAGLNGYECKMFLPAYQITTSNKTNA